MKSITVEASSLLKAIEQGWTKAGKPKNFSVKVFQDAEKNFIGMTTRPAKVGIFFETETAAPARSKREPRARHTPERAHERRVTNKPAAQARQARPIIQKPEPVAHEEPRNDEPRVFWTDEMTEISNEWLKTILATMNLSNISYSSKTINNQLRILFDKPLHENEEKERQLYRSFSLLILQTLRHKLQRPLRGFKVVLLSES